MELLEIPFTGPVLPATLAVIMALAWSLLTTLGAFHLDHWFGVGHDADIDSGLDVNVDIGAGLEGNTVHGSALGRKMGGALDARAEGGLQMDLGSADSPVLEGATQNWLTGSSIAVLRWLNLGGVPLMIWAAIFSVAWWFVSGFLWIAVDRYIFEPNLLWTSLLTVKNLILAALLTKLVTVPLKRSLTPNRITIRSLIGKECLISSTEATPDFGLVKFKTGGAPLLLNVRTDGPRLSQGTPVWIVHYDRSRRVYIVSPTSTRAVDPDAEKLKGESKNADL